MEIVSEFNLVFIGKVIDYLPYFIYTFEELGKDRQKFSAEEIKDISAKLIYNGEKKVLHKEGTCEIKAESVRKDEKLNSVQIEFLTSTRIKYKGNFTKDINFEIIIRNLLRRLSLLSQYHCDEKWDIDFNQVIKEAKGINIIARNLHNFSLYMNCDDNLFYYENLASLVL